MSVLLVIALIAPHARCFNAWPKLAASSVAGEGVNDFPKLAAFCVAVEDARETSVTGLSPVESACWNTCLLRLTTDYRIRSHTITPASSRHHTLADYLHVPFDHSKNPSRWKNQSNIMQG